MVSMNAEAPHITEALDALRGLTAEQILARLAEVRADEAQLRTLLRAVHARDRQRCQAAAEEGGAS
jgi:hypothetical protein